MATKTVGDVWHTLRFFDPDVFEADLDANENVVKVGFPSSLELGRVSRHGHHQRDR